MHFSTIAFPCIFNSTPAIKPIPLTSFIKLYLFFNSLSLKNKYSLKFCAFVSNFSFWIAVNTASAALQMTGPPPNVEACVPGCKVSAISFFTTMTPIGKPPPNAFASIIISGVIP